jgi:hypothetical protein
MADKNRPLSLTELIERLQTEPVQFVCWHKVAEYDNAYTIRYDAASAMFMVHVEWSVWDGRGNGTADEMIDETTLLTRLTELIDEGKIVSMAFEYLD